MAVIFVCSSIYIRGIFLLIGHDVENFEDSIDNYKLFNVIVCHVPFHKARMSFQKIDFFYLFTCLTPLTYVWIIHLDFPVSCFDKIV
jgi:hypothetical protein